MLTVEEARVRLGLEPFDEFRKKGEERYGNRRLGTTTKMLVEAVVAAQSKTVAIKGYVGWYSRNMTRTARWYAFQLGINPLNLQPYPHVGAELIFVDHYRREEYNEVLS